MFFHAAPIVCAPPSTQPQDARPDHPDGVHCLVVWPVVLSAHVELLIESARLDRRFLRTARAATHLTAHDVGGGGLPGSVSATSSRLPACMREESGARCSVHARGIRAIWC